MTTKCQLCRNWAPIIREGVRGYGLCTQRPVRADGKPEMHFMAAWNDQCPLAKFVSIVPAREQAVQ